MDKKKTTNIFNKTFKLSLIVYLPILAAVLIICLGLGFGLHNWTFMFAFLISLIPSLFFVFMSTFLPIERIFTYGSKGMIVLWVFLYILKYVILFVVPIICFFFANNIFNKWIMLTMAIIAPVLVFVLKLITTYKKDEKKDEQKTINTIKF